MQNKVKLVQSSRRLNNIVAGNIFTTKHNTPFTPYILITDDGRYRFVSLVDGSYHTDLFIVKNPKSFQGSGRNFWEINEYIEHFELVRVADGSIIQITVGDDYGE